MATSISPWLDWQAVRRRVARGLAIWLVLTPVSLAAQTAPGGSPAPELAPSGGPAVVAVEFLEDGRCHVSAEGQGFRSNATYTPQASGIRGEQRCAMPPVPKGLTVDLTVVVPNGTPRPAQSEPVLEWSAALDGRWTGTGSLTDWPDVIVVTSPTRTWTFWGPTALMLVIASVGASVGGVAMRRRRVRRAGAA